MSELQERRIVALVLTHNAPQSLARCLAGIDAQAEGPDDVIRRRQCEPTAGGAVALPRSGRSWRVIRSEVNSGPAGGWAIALR